MCEGDFKGLFKKPAKPSFLFCLGIHVCLHIHIILMLTTVLFQHPLCTYVFNFYWRLNQWDEGKFLQGWISEKVDSNKEQQGKNVKTLLMYLGTKL